MVVTLLSPTSAREVWQGRTGWAFMWTVQAPQSACPHPNFVPFRPRRSRMAHKRGIVGSTPSRTRSCPLTVSFIAYPSLFRFTKLPTRPATPPKLFLNERVEHCGPLAFEVSVLLETLFKQSFDSLQ